MLPRCALADGRGAPKYELGSSGYWVSGGSDLRLALGVISTVRLTCEWSLF